MKGNPTTLPQEDGSINTRNQEQDGPNTDNENASTSELKSLVVYGKFIFVPGDTQLFFDGFSNDFIGDFPAKWNTYGGGEIVQLSGSNQKWFELKMSSYFIPDVPSLPKKYTIEFDVLTTGLNRQTFSQAKLHVILDASNAFGYGNNAVYTYLQFC
jgi:OOP family OmpA-OmpF porin